MLFLKPNYSFNGFSAALMKPLKPKFGFKRALKPNLGFKGFSGHHPLKLKLVKPNRIIRAQLSNARSRAVKPKPIH